MFTEISNSTDEEKKTYTVPEKFHVQTDDKIQIFIHKDNELVA